MYNDETTNHADWNEDLTMRRYEKVFPHKQFMEWEHMCFLHKYKNRYIYIRIVRVIKIYKDDDKQKMH